MAGLSNQKLMRDLPTQVDSQSPSALASYIDSLPDNERGNLNPGDPKHMPMIEQLYQATIEGQLDKQRVDKIAKRNPRAAPLFYRALSLQMARNDKTARAHDILNSSTEGAALLPPDQVGPQRQGTLNYGRAIDQFAQAGDYETAKAYADLRKTIAGKPEGGGSPTTTLLGMRAANQKTGNEELDKIAPADAQAALDKIQSPIVINTVGPGGRQVTDVRARSKATGGTYDTGRNVFDDDVAKISKAYKEGGFAEMDTFVDSLDQQFEKYKKTGIPGIGLLKNSNWTTFMKSKEGREVYADTQAVLGSILRQGAGLSQTEGEARRLLAKMASGTFNTAEDFYTQFQKVKSQYDKDRGAVVAGARPEAIDIWQGNNPSGVDLRESPWQKRARLAKSKTPDSERARLIEEIKKGLKAP